MRWDPGMCHKRELVGGGIPPTEIQFLRGDDNIRRTGVEWGGEGKNGIELPMGRDKTLY